MRFFANVDRENKQRLLRACTMLSVPAEYGEAFGLYLLEAWALGLPVVQPASGAFPELIESTGGGILYPPGETGAHAEALAVLLDDPDGAREMGARVRAAVRARFTAGRTAAAVADVCRTALMWHAHSKGSTA